MAFLVVGGINTVVGFAIFVACSKSVGHLVDQRFGTLAGSLVTLGISHVLGVLFAFVMHRRVGPVGTYHPNGDKRGRPRNNPVTETQELVSALS